MAAWCHCWVANTFTTAFSRLPLLAAYGLSASVAAPASVTELEDFRRLPSGRGHGDHTAGHSHDGFERHHHGSQDATVMALDDGASTDEAGGAAAPHPLAFTHPTSFVCPPLAPLRWAAAQQHAVDPWIADAAERPPKA